MTQHDGTPQTDALFGMAGGTRSRKGKKSRKGTLLSAGTVAEKFMGALQKCLTECQEQARERDVGKLTLEARWDQLRQIKDRIRLVAHGPAVQMDVYSGSPKTSSKLYSVDMVPTIQISGANDKDEYYVAKPIKKKKKKQASGGQIEWRRSFSLDEKKLLETADKKDNGCRKQVLRVLKVMRLNKSDLRRLSSFHYKTMLFRVMDKLSKLSDKELWKAEHLGERLMDVLEQMEEELSEGVMPNYFAPEVNILHGMKDSNIDNMRRRLKNLRISKERMMGLLESVEHSVTSGVVA